MPDRGSSISSGCARPGARVETRAPAPGSAGQRSRAGAGEADVDVGKIAQGDRAHQRRAPLRAVDTPPVDDGSIIVTGGEPRPLIPSGTYDATCVGAKRGRLGRAPKLICLFDVHLPTDTDLGVRRVRLARYYNVTDLPGGRLR